MFWDIENVFQGMKCISKMYSENRKDVKFEMWNFQIVLFMKFYRKTVACGVFATELVCLFIEYIKGIVKWLQGKDRGVDSFSYILLFLKFYFNSHLIPNYAKLTPSKQT